MKILLKLILILISIDSFSFSSEFQIKKTDNTIQKVKLDLLVGSIWYQSSLGDKALQRKELIMYSYFGGNRDEEFYNSCAIVEYKLRCLGKLVPTEGIQNDFGPSFCVEPMKLKKMDTKILYTSFIDKFKCKKMFDELIRSSRGSERGSIYCPFVKNGKLLDQFVDFENENKKGIADEK